MLPDAGERKDLPQVIQIEDALLELRDSTASPPCRIKGPVPFAVSTKGCLQNVVDQHPPPGAGDEFSQAVARPRLF
jgi:hypothetical protein